MVKSTKSTRGGARPGAGRKKKVLDAPVPVPGLSAERYLAKVVAGELPADPSRVRAALGLIRYEAVQKRAPLRGPAPKVLVEREKHALEAQALAAWNAKAKKIRDRLAKKKTS